MQIFMSGIFAFTATEAEVRQVFEGYGTVETVRLMTDRDAGRPRGFGFVEMPTRHGPRRDCRTQRQHPWRTDADDQRGAPAGRAWGTSAWRGPRW